MRDLLSIGTSRGCEMIGTGIGLGLSGYRLNPPGVLPVLDLQFSSLKTLTAAIGPTPSFSRASSGTYFDSSGVLQTASTNGARFDHTYDGTSWISRGLLVEEQRTNLATYSEDFGNAAWTKSGGSVSTNQIAAPDGQTTADKFTENSAGGAHFILGPAGSVANSTIFSVSAFVKKGDRKYVYLTVNDGTSTRLRYTVIFDLDLVQMVNEYSIGSPSNTGYSITDCGNGWFRISAKIQTGSSQAYACETAIGMSDSASPSGRDFTNPTYTGNGSSYFYCWGIQSESGAFPTSYIPSLSSSSTTRSADVCQITGSDFSSIWNATEGTIAADFDRILNTGVRPLYSIFGSAESTNLIYQFPSGGNESCEVWVSNSPQCQLAIGSTPANGTTGKSAFAFKQNDFAGSLNGAAVVTDTSGSLTVCTQMKIGCATTNYLNGHIARLRYWNTRLDNATLRVLST